MAARRASMRLYNAFQSQKSSMFWPGKTAAAESIALPRLAAVAAFSRSDVWSHGFERAFSVRAFPARQLHSDAQARTDGEETHEYEKTKMASEGGGFGGHTTYHEKASEVKQKKEEVMAGASDKADELKDKAGDVKDSVSDKAEDVKDSVSDKAGDVKDSVSDKAGDVKDSVSDKAGDVKDSVSEKAPEEAKGVLKEVTETATGIKEVGVEAAKAVKRDAAKVAEKVGLKSE